MDLEALVSMLVDLSSSVSINSLRTIAFWSVDTASRFVPGESLGLLNDDKPKGTPVSGEDCLKAFSAFSDRLWASDVSRRFQGSGTKIYDHEAMASRP